MMQVHFSVGRYPVWRVRSAGSTSIPMLARCLVWRVGTAGFQSAQVSGPYQCWVGARFRALESHIPVLIGKTQTGTRG